MPELAQNDEQKPFVLPNLPVPDPNLTFSALGFTKNLKPEEIKDANNA